MPSPEPQPILGVPTEAAIFLVLTVAAGAEAAVAGLLADAPGIKRSVGFRVPEGELSCVIGIGAAMWDPLGAARGARRRGCIRSLNSPARATRPWPPQAICSFTSVRTGSTCASSWPSG